MKNRLEKRAALLKESENLDILSICQSVKNGIDGMADKWADDEVLRIHKFLICCLDTWEPTGFKIQEAYDNCVKDLVVETVKLINYYLARRVSINEYYQKSFCPTL